MISSSAWLLGACGLRTSCRMCVCCRVSVLGLHLSAAVVCVCVWTVCFCWRSYHVECTGIRSHLDQVAQVAHRLSAYPQLARLAGISTETSRKEGELVDGSLQADRGASGELVIFLKSWFVPCLELSASLTDWPTLQCDHQKGDPKASLSTHDRYPKTKISTAAR